MYKFFGFILFSILINVSLSSCKSDNSGGKKKVVVDPNQQSEFDNLVSAIDASPATDSSVSLRFENDEFQRKQLSLFLYENIGCTKWILEEEKKDGSKRKVLFYFNKGKLFHSSEITSSDNSVRQTNSYYNEKMEGVYSSERRSENYLDLESSSLKPVDFIEHNIKESMDIKDASGLFATKFVEFINFEGVDFIRVGQKENGGYWTDIVVPEMTDSIKKLEKSKPGTPMKIIFKIKTINGFDYQVIETISY
ncbi:MAG: hypothetical protein ACKO6A_08230 [Bacteroidota bacterium]